MLEQLKSENDKQKDINQTCQNYVTRKYFEIRKNNVDIHL